MRALLITLLVFATSQLIGQTEEEAIKNCYNGYKQAILDDRGADAVEYIDQHTLEYYTTCLDRAIYMDSASVEKLQIVDKMTVLGIRHRIPKEDIYKMDNRALFQRTIEEGMISKNSVKSSELGVVRIEGNFATGNVVADGSPTPINFHFYKEENDWKIDLTSIFPVPQKALSQMISDLGVSETDFTLQSLGQVTGSAPTRSILNPLKTR